MLIPISSRGPQVQNRISPAAADAPAQILETAYFTREHHSSEPRHNVEPTSTISILGGPDIADSTKPPNSDPSLADIEERAPKRRRLSGIQQEEGDVPKPTSDNGANVPIPTTELPEVTAESSGTTDRNPARSMYVKPKKSQISTQAKRRGQDTDAAPGNSTDAVQGQAPRTKRPRKNAGSKVTQGARDDGNQVRVGSSTDPAGQNIPSTVSPKPKRKRMRKAQQSAEEAAAEVVEDAIGGASMRSKKGGRRRADTPEGADAVVISPSAVKMSELCKGSRIGKKSGRQKRIEELERIKKASNAQNELQEMMGQGEHEIQAETLGNGEARSQELGGDTEEEDDEAANVPNLHIVQGQIVLDDASLQIDRHAEAAAKRNAQQLAPIDENEFTRKSNSGSYLKRDKSGCWNEEKTERFYDGLRMFGTDFGIISKMFPGRTRHSIKLKYDKEMKYNQEKIKATLLGEQLPVDLPEFEQMTETRYKDPEELEKEIAEDLKKLEQESLLEKEAIEEARREREEQIAAERAAGADESSAKENRKGRKKGKKGGKRKGETGLMKRKGKGNRAMGADATSGANVQAEGADTTVT